MSRIVVTTIGSLGDLHPKIAISLELRRRGHQVIFATHREYQSKIETLGFEFRRIRPDNTGLEDPEEMARGMDLKTGSEYIVRDWICANLRETYVDLIACCQDVDFIVAGEGVWAARLVAEKLNIGWTLAVLQPISFFSPYDPPVIPIFPYLAKLRRFGFLVNWGIFQFSKIISKSWVKPLHQIRKELTLPPLDGHPLFDAKYSPHLVLALFSSVIAQAQSDWVENTVITGFTFYDGGQNLELTPKLKQFLAAGEPPVVFTLGSAAVMSPGNFYPESIKAVRSLNCRAVLLIGKNPSPAGLTEDIIAVDYVPYSLIFPYASAIVHQGGIGTTAQALKAGCPTLIMPYSHDQPDNAARVQRLGTSLTISRKKYYAERVAKELKKLLVNLNYKTKAEEIARLIRAEDGAKVACDAIEKQLKRVS